MFRGIYTAASGMLNTQVRHALIANNIANVNTSGYKRDEAVYREFPRMLIKRVNESELESLVPMPFNFPGKPQTIGSIGTGALTDETVTVFDRGQLRQTNNQMDMALDGPGFFSVLTPQGIRYTRAGNMTIDKDSNLVTPQGFPILGKKDYYSDPEPIKLNQTGTLDIDPNGYINENDLPLAKLHIVNFEDTSGLRKIGNNLFAAPEGLVPTEDTIDYVRQGYKEMPNFSIISEMVQMIEANRAYDFCQRAITAYDGTLQKTVNEINQV